ncbi:hypothetical protein [Sinorhizobium meliloti]|uniref:hypothetical protein n=1 Tax=Rhizobium meliloti TaxID=382 RepID=UPI0012950F7C|nr:hypothetical protein [Sinorhizobium meliloti]MQX92074.1 hypothetical protein [Sinorhizobium meliloti]
MNAGVRGLGRFITFKVFGEVFYSSRQNDPRGWSGGGSCRYEPFAKEDNLIEVSPDVRAGFTASRLAYCVDEKTACRCAEFFEREGDRYSGADADDAIVAALLDHFRVRRLIAVSLNDPIE